MHRSGTSAITRVCSLLGASLPTDLLPPDPDNEPGYWESRELLEVNKALLAGASTTWFDDLPIPDSWFESPAARTLRPRAVAFLQELVRSQPLVVLKDPRLCRLWPFWRSVLEELAVVPHVVLALRHPFAVSRSLRKRAERPDIRSAAITCADKSHLLWLRYVLESERQTRGAIRSVVTYDGLLAHRRPTIERLAAQLGCFPRSPDEAESALDEFLSVRLRHHEADDDDRRSASACVAGVYRTLAAHADEGARLDLGRLDAARDALDSVEGAYAPLRSTHRRTSANASRWEPEMLERLASRLAARESRTPRVLYVSGNPHTRGHVYRVVHHVAALRAAGCTASWVSVADLSSADIGVTDVLVVWRAAWSDELARVFEHCRARQALVGFDADDLVFDPALMTVHNSDYLRRADAETRRHWLEDLIPGYARTLAESDFALVSTAPLARAAVSLGTRAFVLPHGVDAAMIEAADEALVDRASRPVGGPLRLGYASGTPTHQKDFATVAPVLASLLGRSPELILTIVGCLAIEDFPELTPHRDRIELRPLVPFSERFREYARFDVNLAPLEASNAFCEGKSELKYFEPALVGVPTVATATPPFVNAIMQGETGFCASTGEEWLAAIELLLADAAERARVGALAREHAIAAFGPDAQRDRAGAVFGAIATLKARAPESAGLLARDAQGSEG